jgi:hypothetical protein
MPDSSTVKTRTTTTTAVSTLATSPPNYKTKKEEEEEKGNTRKFKALPVKPLFPLLFLWCSYGASMMARKEGEWKCLE